MTDYKSRIYLDVDGVLNPLRAPHASHKGGWMMGDVKVSRGGGLVERYHMQWVPSVIQEIQRIRDDFDAELVWLSTWNQDYHINKLPRLWHGLHGGRILPWSGTNDISIPTREFTAWKADALLADQARDPLPFVWVDDEAVNFHGSKVQEAHPEAVLVGTHGGKGISTTELMIVSAFAKAASNFEPRNAPGLPW